MHASVAHGLAVNSVYHVGNPFAVPPSSGRRAIKTERFVDGVACKPRPTVRPEFRTNCVPTVLDTIRTRNEPDDRPGDRAAGSSLSIPSVANYRDRYRFRFRPRRSAMLTINFCNQSVLFRARPPPLNATVVVYTWDVTWSAIVIDATHTWQTNALRLVVKTTTRACARAHGSLVLRRRSSRHPSPIVRCSYCGHTPRTPHRVVICFVCSNDTR